ncbi:hypothetical protein DASC09_059710 [Saccharomycopsis crataegensis]|uniref:Uncharacterized protein n=1 Tax=Saccharomycopsis crataegensis TaxID=43959 RepID=A0AAV5QW23_9ASCO|nr:hypothetical protein DASC09_059710 [Saccharomycopsis crataegensis]
MNPTVEASMSSELSTDVIADIISYDYQGNLTHNRNTVDELFAIGRVSKQVFNEFVNKFLATNKFNYRDVKIEYDDEIQVITYSFPSFFHLISTPILFTLFYKHPHNESEEGHKKNLKISKKISSRFKKRNHDAIHEEEEEDRGEEEDEEGNESKDDDEKIIVDKTNNLIVTYYQVNNFLPILLKSKNKVASLNKDLLIVPDGVILNPDSLTEPIFSIEITNMENLEKMRHKILHSYSRFKRPNSYRTILLLIFSYNLDITVEVWKKVPIPQNYETESVAKLVKGAVNIPKILNKKQEYQKISDAIREAKYLNLNPQKHKFTYYLQNKAYPISYDSCNYQTKIDEENGIPLHYFDIHFPISDPKEEEKYKSSMISLHYDEIRNLIGELIRNKVNMLKGDVDNLSIVENIRNRAKKNYFDLCDLDFPTA